MDIEREFFELNEGISYLILGPRGTGKSTYLKNNIKNSLIINLLEPDTLRSFLAKPERLYEVVNSSDKNNIIIDEIQKCPELLNVVHDLIEKNKKKVFILTGSSARKLKKTSSNLLAGRAIFKKFHPFIASELKDDFNLELALEVGLLPIVYNSKDKLNSLKTYLELYIKEEVKEEGLVRNAGDFYRALEVFSFSHAEQINISNIATEVEVGRKSIESYLSILEDLLISFRVPVFSKRIKKKVVKQAKFYFFDAGVFNYLKPGGVLEQHSNPIGAALEGLVAQHLRAWIDYTDNQDSLYFWRTKSGTEVDFIVYGNSGFYAIEVKNSKNIRRSDLKSLKSFIDDYPEAKPIILYRGKEVLKIDQIDCIPVDQFLINLIPKKEINT